jgi:hypothetical protein
MQLSELMLSQYLKLKRSASRSKSSTLEQEGAETSEGRRRNWSGKRVTGWVLFITCKLELGPAPSFCQVLPDHLHHHHVNTPPSVNHQRALRMTVYSLMV